MYKTQKNHIRCNKQTYRLLRILCHVSKNLYNYALYHIRQHYLNTQQYLRADINGAINILAKVAGESAAKQIVSSGRVNRPVRIRVVQKLPNFSRSLHL
ncbi:MAG: hypothetical protein KatS3mg101_1135 [Patescibacteria group bacterium]|nr:MAG: hypothetical protein KatS3mg101_1135 [Patescibacteria group bacterium]